MKLHRVVCEWAGAGVVGRAVTVLHFDGTENAAPPVAAIKSAFALIAPRLPSGVTVTIPSTGDSIDDTTGDLNGVWSTTGGGPVSGSSGPNVAAGVGACISWTTGGIVTGIKGPRKLRGRTFLVPLAAANYAADGTLDTVALGDLQNGANALQAAGGLAVWHRPTTPGGSDGTSYAVIANKVRDKVAFLSSRRD